MERKMRKHFTGCALMFLLFFIYAFEAHASNIVLTSCSSSEVNDAISSASDGDTIACPSGTWSWKSSVTINNKNITLQGTGIDGTTITLDSAGTPGIYVSSGNTKAFRITGFTFHSRVLIGEDRGDGIIRILGGSGWRIDHSKFLIYSDRTNWDGGNAIVARNGAVGLIDHNEFRGSPNSSGCWHSAVYALRDNTSGWALPSQIGTGNNTMFIEDNIMEETRTDCFSHNGHTVDSAGGFYVFRHNKVTNLNTDAHGFCQNYGTREFEISNNDLYVTGNNVLWALTETRGGTGVIYNNVNHGPSSSGAGIWLVEYRDGNSGSCGSIVQNGISANSDCGSKEGYPCTDQIGRGQNQKSDPLYIWNNTGMSITNDNPSYIQSGRDYVLNQGPKPGYTPYPYPHPLSGGGNSPNPPTNIRVNQ